MSGLCLCPEHKRCFENLYPCTIRAFNTCTQPNGGIWMRHSPLSSSSQKANTVPVAEEEHGKLDSFCTCGFTHEAMLGWGQSPQLLTSLARCPLCVLRCLLFKLLSTSLAGRPATSREAAPCPCNPAPAQEARCPGASRDYLCSCSLKQ